MSDPLWSDTQFVLDYTRMMLYYRCEYKWGPAEEEAFTHFIDDLLRLGYKMQVTEHFRSEADGVRRANCEARLAVIKAKRK